MGHILALAAQNLSTQKLTVSGLTLLSKDAQPGAGWSSGMV